MKLQSLLAVIFIIGETSATPIYGLNDAFNERTNAVFVRCDDTSTDPLCLEAKPKHPYAGVLSSTLLPDGTWSKAVPSNHTRESLLAVRIANNVTSNSPNAFDPVAHMKAAKRESAPPICISERQKWYDTHEWGYWYNSWHQVGNCFYCDSADCSWGIQVAFSVTETWTWGLDVNFDDVMHVTFGYSWGQTQGITSTRTCHWAAGVNWGCNSIWFQPLLTYHNGYPNYQTHTHCSAAQGQAATDSYYDHNWVFANANQGAGGLDPGNFGCGSGCGGSDHRQCTQGNSGGSLWPYAN